MIDVRRYTFMMKSLLFLAFLSIPVLGGHAASFESGMVTTDQGGILSSVTTLETEHLQRPSGLAVLPDGTLLTADTENHVIRRLHGENLSDFSLYAGFYFRDEEEKRVGGLVDGQLFQHPLGLEVDAKGRVYVADAGNHAIRRITPEGHVETLAGNGILGLDDGKRENAQFYHPSDIAVAQDGTVYVADTLNHAIRKIAPDGTVTTLTQPGKRAVEASSGEVTYAGGYKDGALSQAMFNEPYAVELDGQGNLYVSDSGNHVIRYIDFQAKKVSTVAGSLPRTAKGSVYADGALYAKGGFKDGTADQARFHFPKGLDLTSEGGVLIADRMNHRLRYFKDGRVYTLAGTGEEGTSDGLETQAQFNRPLDVAVLSDGTVAVADAFNHRLRMVERYTLPIGEKRSRISLVYEKEVLMLEPSPAVRQGRMMVSFRSFLNRLGYDVETNGSVVTWMQDGEQDRVDLHKVMPASKGSFSFITPVKREGAWWVPIRLAADVTGLDLQWNEKHRMVILRDP